MTSPFDPVQQEQSLDAKIIAALEKISEVFRVMLWEAGKKDNLSPIQVQVLVFLLYHDPSKARVTLLADEFNMTKPTMSEVIQALEDKKLVEKTRDLSDSRTFAITLSPEGKLKAEKLASFAKPMEISMKDLEEREKEEVFSGIYKLLTDMAAKKLISTLRHCEDCSSFEGNNVVSWCKHFQKALTQKDLRIDCEAHTKRKNL